VFRIGRVDTIREDTQEVTVRVGPQSHIPCKILNETTGDAWYPDLNDRVVIAPRTNGKHVVIGGVMDNNTISDGERVIGHSGSETTVKFNDDGSIDIIPDGQTDPSLTIDNSGLHFADNQVVTDIDTTKDADGHVESVTPIYTTSISL